MNVERKVKTIDFAVKDLFVGIDVHKKRWVITVRTIDLELRTFSMNYPYPEKLHETLEKFFPGGIYHLVYEAGFSGYSLYDYFHEKGIDITVTPPQRVPTDHSRIKTDRIDSRKLAKYLSQGLLRAVVVPDKSVRQLRYAFTFLDKIKNHRMQVRLQIGSLFDFLDHDLKSQRWTKRLVSELSDLEFDEEIFQRVFRVIVDYYNYCDKTVQEIESVISEISEDDRYKERIGILSKVKGIGTLSAIRFVLYLFDRKDRFERGESLSHYVGLTPSEHSSGGKERKGGITRNGDAHLRGLIIQIAWQVVRWDPALMEKYESVLKRCGSAQKAIVAVARKLMVKLHSIMVRRQPYLRGVVS